MSKRRWITRMKVHVTAASAPALCSSPGTKLPEPPNGVWTGSVSATCSDHCTCLSLYLCFSTPLSLPVSLSTSLYLSLPSLYLSLYLHLSTCLFTSVSLPLYHCLSTRFSMPVSIVTGFSLFTVFSLFLSLSPGEVPICGVSSRRFGVGGHEP